MTTTISLQNLIAGNLNTETYNYITKYTKGLIKKAHISLPNHITLDDIVSEVIISAYTNREQYNKEIAYEVTWYGNIAFNHCKAIYNKYNKQKLKNIPMNNFVHNTITNDEGATTCIFDTITDINETDIDDVFNESNGLSEEVRMFIKENNFDELYARLYDIPEGDAPNGSYRKYDLITYEELAVRFDINYTTLNNRIFYQTQHTINHFNDKKINVKERKIKNKTPQHLLDYQKEYKLKNKQKLLDYQKEYRESKKKW